MAGRFDEFHAGPVEDDAFLQLADTAVRDPSLDDDGSLAERQTKVVQRVELQRERRLDHRAAPADVEDRHRLENLHLPKQRCRYRDAFGVALVLVCHVVSYDYTKLYACCYRQWQLCKRRVGAIPIGSDLRKP